MAITWSDAVADVDNADDAALYDRAVAQAFELDAFMQSFIVAVIESGKWPTQPRSDYDSTPVPRTLRSDYRPPSFTADTNGRWSIEAVGLSGNSLVRSSPGGQPVFGSKDRTTVIANPDFHARMAAMDDSKNWVPRALVAYLRSENIKIPSDS